MAQPENSKNIIKNFLNKPLKSIIIFCIVSLFFAIAFFSDVTTTPFKIGIIIVYLLFLSSMLFNNLKRILVNLSVFGGVIVFASYTSSLVFKIYQIEIAHILLPSVLAIYFGNLAIIEYFQIKKYKILITLFILLDYLLLSLITISITKNVVPIIYMSLVVIIIAIESYIFFLYKDKLK